MGRGRKGKGKRIGRGGRERKIEVVHEIMRLWRKPREELQFELEGYLLAELSYSIREVSFFSIKTFN